MLGRSDGSLLILTLVSIVLWTSARANPCLAGTYYTGTECVNCPGGQSSSAGATTCSDCTAGQYSNSSTNYICTDCGYYAASGFGSSVCTVCPFGFIRSQDKTSCVSCEGPCIQACTPGSDCMLALGGTNGLLVIPMQGSATPGTAVAGRIIQGSNVNDVSCAVSDLGTSVDCPYAFVSADDVAYVQLDWNPFDGFVHDPIPVADPSPFLIPVTQGNAATKYFTVEEPLYPSLPILLQSFGPLPNCSNTPRCSYQRIWFRYSFENGTVVLKDLTNSPLLIRQNDSLSTVAGAMLNLCDADTVSNLQVETVAFGQRSRWSWRRCVPYPVFTPRTCDPDDAACLFKIAHSSSVDVAFPGLNLVDVGNYSSVSLLVYTDTCNSSAFGATFISTNATSITYNVPSTAACNLAGVNVSGWHQPGAFKLELKIVPGVYNTTPIVFSEYIYRFPVIDTSLTRFNFFKQGAGVTGLSSHWWWTMEAETEMFFRAEIRYGVTHYGAIAFTTQIALVNGTGSVTGIPAVQSSSGDRATVLFSSPSGSWSSIWTPLPAFYDLPPHSQVTVTTQWAGQQSSRLADSKFEEVPSSITCVTAGIASCVYPIQNGPSPYARAESFVFSMSKESTKLDDVSVYFLMNGTTSSYLSNNLPVPSASNYKIEFSSSIVSLILNVGGLPTAEPANDDFPESWPVSFYFVRLDGTLKDQRVRTPWTGLRLIRPITGSAWDDLPVIHINPGSSFHVDFTWTNYGPRKLQYLDTKVGLLTAQTGANIQDGIYMINSSHVNTTFDLSAKRVRLEVLSSANLTAALSSATREWRGDNHWCVRVGTTSPLSYGYAVYPTVSKERNIYLRLNTWSLDSSCALGGLNCFPPTLLRYEPYPYRNLTFRGVDFRFDSPIADPQIWLRVPLSDGVNYVMERCEYLTGNASVATCTFPDGNIRASLFDWTAASSNLEARLDQFGVIGTWEPTAYILNVDYTATPTWNFDAATCLEESCDVLLKPATDKILHFSGSNLQFVNPAARATLSARVQLLNGSYIVETCNIQTFNLTYVSCSISSSGPIFAAVLNDQTAVRTVVQMNLTHYGISPSWVQSNYSFSPGSPGLPQPCPDPSSWSCALVAFHEREELVINGSRFDMSTLNDSIISLCSRSVTYSLFPVENPYITINNGLFSIDCGISSLTANRIVCNPSFIWNDLTTGGFGYTFNWNTTAVPAVAQATITITGTDYSASFVRNVYRAPRLYSESCPSSGCIVPPIAMPTNLVPFRISMNEFVAVNAIEDVLVTLESTSASCWSTATKTVTTNLAVDCTVPLSSLLSAVSFPRPSFRYSVIGFGGRVLRSWFLNIYLDYPPVNSGANCTGTCSVFRSPLGRPEQDEAFFFFSLLSASKLNASWFQSANVSVGSNKGNCRELTIFGDYQFRCTVSLWSLVSQFPVSTSSARLVLIDIHGQEWPQVPIAIQVTNSELVAPPLLDYFPVWSASRSMPQTVRLLDASGRPAPTPANLTSFVLTGFGWTIDCMDPTKAALAYDDIEKQLLCTVLSFAELPLPVGFFQTLTARVEIAAGGLDWNNNQSLSFSTIDTKILLSSDPLVTIYIPGYPNPSRQSAGLPSFGKAVSFEVCAQASSCSSQSTDVMQYAWVLEVYVNFASLPLEWVRYDVAYSPISDPHNRTKIDNSTVVYDWDYYSNIVQVPSSNLVGTSSPQWRQEGIYTLNVTVEGYPGAVTSYQWQYIQNMSAYGVVECVDNPGCVYGQPEDPFDAVPIRLRVRPNGLSLPVYPEAYGNSMFLTFYGWSTDGATPLGWGVGESQVVVDWIGDWNQRGIPDIIVSLDPNTVFGAFGSVAADRTRPVECFATSRDIYLHQCNLGSCQPYYNEKPCTISESFYLQSVTPYVVDTEPRILPIEDLIAANNVTFNRTINLELPANTEVLLSVSGLPRDYARCNNSIEKVFGVVESNLTVAGCSGSPFAALDPSQLLYSETAGGCPAVRGYARFWAYATWMRIPGDFYVPRPMQTVPCNISNLSDDCKVLLPSNRTFVRNLQWLCPSAIVSQHILINGVIQDLNFTTAQDEQSSIQIEFNPPLNESLGDALLQLQISDSFGRTVVFDMGFGVAPPPPVAQPADPPAAPAPETLATPIAAPLSPMTLQIEITGETSFTSDNATYVSEWLCNEYGVPTGSILLTVTQQKKRAAVVTPVDVMFGAAASGIYAQVQSLPSAFLSAISNATGGAFQATLRGQAPSQAPTNDNSVPQSAQPSVVSAPIASASPNSGNVGGGSSSVGPIVGGIVGGVLAIAFIIVIVVVVLKKRKRADSRDRFVPATQIVPSRPKSDQRIAVKAPEESTEMSSKGSSTLSSNASDSSSQAEDSSDVDELSGSQSPDEESEYGSDSGSRSSNQRSGSYEVTDEQSQSGEPSDGSNDESAEESGESSSEEDGEEEDDDESSAENSLSDMESASSGNSESASQSDS